MFSLMNNTHKKTVALLNTLKTTVTNQSKIAGLENGQSSVVIYTSSLSRAKKPPTPVT